MTSFTPQEIESLQGQGNEVRAALRLLPFLSLYKFDKFYMSELSLNFFPNETLDKLTTLRSFQRVQLSFNIILMQVPLWEHARCNTPSVFLAAFCVQFDQYLQVDLR